MIGFHEDNSYELFDINSKLEKVPPFATGTLPFINGQNESIRYVFNTDVKNEIIIMTLDNIYRVKINV